MSHMDFTKSIFRQLISEMFSYPDKARGYSTNKDLQRMMVDPMFMIV